MIEVLMKNSFCTIVSPDQMSEEQKTNLVSLHQKYVTLSRDTILDLLQARDKIYLYYHTETKHLIATAGIQYICLQNNVFIYIGNTVVDSHFKHEGCLAHTISKSMIYACLQHPLKNKYWCALASSAGSFSYSQHYQPCWPNPNQSTPKNMTNFMMECIEKIGISDFKIIDGNIITYDLCNKVDGTFLVGENKKKTALKSKTSATSFFNRVNPNAHKGEQLFFINSFKLYKLISSGMISLHHRLIKQPKIYHRLKKKCNTNPLVGSLLILNNLISKKTKWMMVIAITASFTVLITRIA